MFNHLSRLPWLALLPAMLFVPVSALAQEKVLNLYSSRHYETDEALYANFTKRTGIKINRIEGGEDPLIERIRNEAGPGVDLVGWILHSDNGSAMKGATMLATLQRLGVVPSFSRPSVSDDNPYVESLFRTAKYCPHFPLRRFGSVDDARSWVAGFVRSYNDEHQHSRIGFVAPADRHAGRDHAILAARRETYARARERHPERWARSTRPWSRPAPARSGFMPKRRSWCWRTRPLTTRNSSMPTRPHKPASAML